MACSLFMKGYVRFETIAFRLDVRRQRKLAVAKRKEKPPGSTEVLEVLERLW